MLLFEQIREREEKLDAYIRDLAKEMLSKEKVITFAYLFKELYSLEFRHSYSRFFPIITEIGKNKNFSLEFLANNIQQLRELVENDHLSRKGEFNDLFKPLTKLSDHINLEIARYQHYSKKEERTKSLELSLNQSTINLLDAQKQLNVASKKINSVQAELITVLSIFAAIVMAFSGSMTVLGNALEGIGKVAISKSIFCLLLAGFILFNLIFALMYFIGKVTDRNIYARCKTINCTCKDGSPKCNGFVRIRNRLPYVFWFNLIILLLLGFDLLKICFF